MKKNKILNILFDIVIGILGVICVLLLVLRIFFTSVEVSGNSMNPGIVNGSVGYMVKVNSNTKIERFDVVATESEDDYYLIKRVIGLPNETVSLYNNVLTVNGEEISQDFDFIEKTGNFVPYTFELGDDEYLIAGDNRAKTIPLKVVTKDEIFGKNGFCYKVVEDDIVVSRSFYWFKKGND